MELISFANKEVLDLISESRLLRHSSGRPWAGGDRVGSLLSAARAPSQRQTERKREKEGKAHAARTHSCTPHARAALKAHQPSATSSTIITTNPSMSPCMASALLPWACISGTSESQTTKIMAPAASDIVYGSIGRQ